MDLNDLSRFRQAAGRRVVVTTLDAAVEWKSSVAIAKPRVNFGSSATTLAGYYVSLTSRVDRIDDILDTPNNERLATTAVSGGENTFDVRRILLGWRLDVRPPVLLDVESLDDIAFRTQETKRKEHKLGGEELLRSGNFFHLPPSAAVLGPFDADGVEALEAAILVDDEVLRGDGVFARVCNTELVNAKRARGAELTVSEVRSDFCVAVVRAEDARPLGPGVVVSAASWGLGKELEVGDRFSTVTHRGTNAVVACVATADDDDVLALCVDVRIVL